jgi:hypothetical protein
MSVSLRSSGLIPFLNYIDSEYTFLLNLRSFAD